MITQEFPTKSYNVQNSNKNKKQQNDKAKLHSDQGKEAPWSSQFKIEIEKPLNRPRFRGRETPWLPPIQIKVEKPLDRHNSRLR